MIDLRSDTVTKPTPQMREVMAGAPVGDDVYGEDPSVQALEAHVAELLGKDDAVFMPTGSMTNQVAIRSHTEPGDRVLMDRASHVVRSEGGAPAALSGVTAHRIDGQRGLFTAEQVRDAVGVRHPYNPGTLNPPATLLSVENTHNGGGGTVWPLAQLEAVVEEARSFGLSAHLDGARLWNASAASGVSELTYAASFDSVSVCCSKGLGAPVGSLLAGGRDFVARARRFKQVFGGGFRQAGILAAGALHAVQNHRDSLVRDHDKAADLADRIHRLAGLHLDPAHVETNIVRFTVDVPAGAFAEASQTLGVRVLPTGRDAVRAVAHRDVSMEDMERAAQVFAEALAVAGDEQATSSRRVGSQAV